MMNFTENTTSSELFKQFQLAFPHWVKRMKQSDHHFSETHINPYHVESDVWTHTFGVCLMAHEMGLSLTEKLACLLHDVGKPISRFENYEKSRVNFIGHEAVSAYVALEFLEKTNLSLAEKTEIFKLISLHTKLFHLNLEKDRKKILQYFAGENAFLAKLINVCTADSRGRFADADVPSFNPEPWKQLLDAVPERAPARQFDKKLIVLVGPSGSGKSSWIAENYPNRPVLSYDKLMKETNDYEADFKKANWDEMDKKIIQQTKEWQDEQVVIADFTNLSAKTRLRYQSWFPNSKH